MKVKKMMYLMIKSEPGIMVSLDLSLLNIVA
jgi:hypothetical protein